MVDQVVPRYEAAIREASRRYDVPCYIIAATIMAESSGVPGAVSPSGAVGLMQVMPPLVEAWIARHPSVTPARFTAEPRLHILCGTWVLALKRANIEAAAKRHGYDVRRAQDWMCIMAAYFGGFVYATGRINWEFRDGAGTSARTALERYTRHWLRYREYFQE